MEEKRLKEKNNIVPYESILFIVIVLIMVALEFLAAKVTYLTMGWVFEAFSILFLLLNIIPIILFLLKWKKSALLLLIIIGACLIPKQIILTNKLLQLREESSNIVSYIYRYKITNDEFPKDISNYKYTYPNLKEHFKYVKFDNDFQLVFFVGSRSTHNFIQYSDPQKWYYVDD